MADTFLNPGDPIDHHAVTGSKPPHNPNPIRQGTHHWDPSAPVKQPQPDEHGGVMRGQLVRDPLPPDDRSPEQRQVDNASYDATVQSEFDNPGSKEAPAMAQNNAMYNLARGGNSVAAGRVQDTNAVIAGVRGDTPDTEYSQNTDGSIGVDPNYAKTKQLRDQ